MQISFVAHLIGALCLATSGTARPPLEAAETTDPDCLADHTYKKIATYGADYVYSSVKFATTSDGYICCDLCHRSNTNCMWASWHKETGNCTMSINTDEGLHGYLGLAPTRKQAEMCPLGVWTEGIVQDRVYDESGYYVGPCWTADDWRAHGFWWWSVCEATAWHRTVDVVTLGLMDRYCLTLNDWALLPDERIFRSLSPIIFLSSVSSLGMHPVLLQDLILKVSSAMSRLISDASAIHCFGVRLSCQVTLSYFSVIDHTVGVTAFGDYG